MNICFKVLSAGLLVSMLSLTSFSQEIWNDQPQIHSLQGELQKESIVMLRDSRTVEVIFDEEKDEAYQLRSLHRIVKLQDAVGVESFNKIVLGEGESGEITDIRCRTIKKNGDVHTIEKEDIRTSKNEYNRNQYHIAFENVAIGDEVEFYYKEKKPLRIFGSELMQFDIPTLEANFTLIAPSHLGFECRGYNGFPDPEMKEDGNNILYSASQKNIPAVKNEEYADVDINSQRLDYKISYTQNSSSRIYTWNDLAKNLNELLYTYGDKETKAVKKLVQEIGVKDHLNEEDKIRVLEDYIKTKFVLNSELDDPNYEDIAYLISKKTSNERGIMRLYIACLEELGIKHEAGVTSNKFEYVIEEDFENWNFLDIYVIYFPNSKKFLLPTNFGLRFPALGAYVEDNKGIFCKRVSAGNITSAVSVIRKFPVTSHNDNRQDFFAEVIFDKESFTPNIKLKHAFSGISAIGIREAVTLMPKEDEKAFVKELAFVADEDKDILNYSFNNKGLQHYSDNKPVEILIELSAGNLIEKAGNKLLFKVGDVIGPQMEMYKSEERVLPISLPFAHGLYREIIIRIPEGYKISNPEAADMNIFYSEDSYGFVSEHKIEGNQMTIYIKEHYGRIYYDKKEIDDFRKVINAAADFNKVTLVFEKI